MKGFKNSTRTQYYKGGEAKGYNMGGRAYGPSADPAPPPQAESRHRLGSLGDAPSAPTSSGGASVSVGRVGRGVTGIVPGSKTAGKGYGGTARVPFAKGGEAKGAAKISKVMGEFKRGELHSGSKKGPEVTSKKQATAIALSEARKAGAKIPQPVQKKSLGGILKAISPAAALAGSGAAPAILGGLIGGPLLASLLKKKQDGTITPAEDKQLAAQQAQQTAAPQTAMKKGGKVLKKYGGGGVDRSMMESTSARPVKVGPTDAEKAAGAAVARGNRMQALEAREEELLRKTDPRSAVMKGDLTRRKTPRELDPRSAVRSSETARASKAVPVASREPKVRNPLMDRLTQLPSQRGEFPIRKSGGGLAVMPKGKKC